MDGDEELDKDTGPKIREAVRSAHNSTINLIHMVLINVDESKDASQQEQSIVNSGKLMRVIPTTYFTRRIHNKLHCAGDTILTEMKIYHYGYALEDKEYMKVKKDRTTKLLLRQFIETPNDPEVPYYLGIQYLRFEEWDKAIKYQKIAIDLFQKYDPHSQLILLAHHVVACANYHQQTVAKTFDFAEAIKFSEMALEIYPDYADSNSILSSIYFALKDYDNCEKHAERFLAACEMLKKDRSKSLVVPMNTLNNEWLIYLQLAINYFEKADSHRAIFFLAKSEDLLPLDKKYMPSFGVFKYLLLRGDAMSLKRAEAIYQEGFRADTRPIGETGI
jgi:tetratricopeptide (TPR) repeat protein